jgi:hypothetical protein
VANTTSGTTKFDKHFAIDEIVEESYERIGLQNVAGYQLKSARRSLNILFQLSLVQYGFIYGAHGGGHL